MSETPAEYLREIFDIVSALARASRTGTGGNLKTSRSYHEPDTRNSKKLQHSPSAKVSNWNRPGIWGMVGAIGFEPMTSTV
jgi:hypothetical protein